MEYIYEKANVNNETLGCEIGNSSVVVTTLSAVTFTEPDILKILFVSELSQAEKDELDSIVSSHSGQLLTHYRFYCGDCLDYKSVRSKNTPSECPECSGIDITDIVNQLPHSSIKDELGNEWEVFMISDGSIINTRRY